LIHVFVTPIACAALAQAQSAMLIFFERGARRQKEAFASDNIYSKIALGFFVSFRGG